MYICTNFIPKLKFQWHTESDENDLAIQKGLYFQPIQCILGPST